MNHRGEHRGIRFELEEATSGKWRWKIYEDQAFGPLESSAEYPRKAGALIACQTRITTLLGAANDA
ncbi:MAG: hypothetical protein JWP25_2030 [Bradyrhizobium sp.]|jgi:hypothetical protein|nr:hypothetical protein [Bradyrhizobium sp.]